MNDQYTPSRIRYVDVVEDEDNGSRRRVRQGKLLSLMGITTGDGGTVRDFVVGVEVVSFLAWKHVNERSGVVVPSLPHELEGCDFQWTLESRNDAGSPSRSVQQVVVATTNTTTEQRHKNHRNSTVNRKRQRQRQRQRQRFLQQQETTPPSPPPPPPPPAYTYGEEEEEEEEPWQYPFAISGATRSSVAIAVSTLASALEVPVMSGSSTSAALDAHPFFARPIPTNEADARAVMVYYKSIGVTHCANLFPQDAWGRLYNADLQREAQALGISMKSFGYQRSDNNQRDIVETLERLKQSGMRYIYAIVKFDWEYILETAHNIGIVGEESQYVWIAAEAHDWTDDSLQLAKNTTRGQVLANALHGVGALSLDVDRPHRLEAAMTRFLENQQLQQEYVQTHSPHNAHLFENYSFANSFAAAGSVYHQMFYDATYSLGVAACRTPGLFTGPDLYQTLVNLPEFEGVTGTIRFDNTTGNRSPDSLRYRIDNLVVSHDKSDEFYTRFETKLAAIVTNGQVRENIPFVYANNSTLPPPPIPPLVHDYNLVPTGVLALGGLLAGGVMLASLALMGWTWLHRNTFVVKASQPIFLYQICIGTFVMAAAIVPLGMQGTKESLGLNVACMSTVWLVCIGFVVALSSLFSKTWRMNQILINTTLANNANNNNNSTGGMAARPKRIEVRARDAIWNLIALLTINVALLIGWTVAAPLSYVREQGNDYDVYGRSLESHGQCKSGEGYLKFLIPLLLVDFIGVATATVQSYKARKLPTEFSESSYLAISMGCLIEILALGGPILFASASSSLPTAFYLILTFLICAICVAISVPVFWPKYIHRNAEPQQVLQSTVDAATRRRNARLRSTATRASSQPLGRGKMSLSRISLRQSSTPAGESEFTPSASTTTGSLPVIASPNGGARTGPTGDGGNRKASLSQPKESPASQRNNGAGLPMDSWGGINLSTVLPNDPPTAISNDAVSADPLHTTTGRTVSPMPSIAESTSTASQASSATKRLSGGSWGGINLSNLSRTSEASSTKKRLSGGSWGGINLSNFSAVSQVDSVDRSDGTKRLSGGSWGGINLSLLSEVSNGPMGDSSVGENNTNADPTTMPDNSNKMSASGHFPLDPVTEEISTALSLDAMSSEFFEDESEHA